MPTTVSKIMKYGTPLHFMLCICLIQKNILQDLFNPIPTGHGRNQPIYERHVTKSGRNRVKDLIGNVYKIWKI